MASSYQGVRIQKTAIESYSTTPPATTHQIVMGAPDSTSRVKDVTNNIMMLQTDTATGNVHGMEIRNYDAGGTEDSVALNGTAGLNYIVNKGSAASTVLPIFTIQQIDSATESPQIHFDTIYVQKIVAGTVEAHTSQYTSIETGGSIYQDIINQSTDAIFNDPWFKKTFVSPPPVLTFNTTTINTSTDIYIFWTAPVQNQFGFTPYKLPALDGLVLTAATASGSTSITTSTTPGLLTTTDRTPAVTGLKLSWQAGTSGVATVTPPGSTAQPMYCYYNSGLKTLVNSADPTKNILTGYYTNTFNDPTAANNGNNPATVNYGIFSSVGAPGAPRNLGSTALAATSLTFTYQAPTQVDITDATSAMTITGYTVTYYSTGSSRRYGSLADASSGSPHSASPTGLSYPATSLFPDAAYTFGVTATNSGDVTGSGASTTLTTSALSPVVSSAISGSLSLPSRFYSSLKRVSDNTTCTKVLNSTSAWTSTSFTAGIHTSVTRGSAVTTPLMSLVANNVYGSTTVGGPTIQYKGFPQAGLSNGLGAANTSLANNITLTTTVTDSYASSPTSHQGFYLQTATTVTISAFTASPSDNVLTVIQSGAYSGSISSPAFQVETIPSGNPTVSAPTVTIQSATTTTKICGVAVVIGAPTYRAVTPVTNLGTYYYVANPVSYSDSFSLVSANETAFTNLTTGAITAGALPASMTFTNSGIVSATLNGAGKYATSNTITVTAQNVNGSANNAGTVAAVFDDPSYALLQSMPSTPPAPGIPGYRVATQTITVSGNTISGSVPTTTAFSNTATLPSGELLLSNGAFRSATGSSTGYINYGSLYGNLGIDYSSVAKTGYRYATFAWKLTANYVNTLSITLNGITNFAKSGSLAIVSDSTNSANLQLFYRFQDSGATYTTPWINGNSLSGTQVGPNTYGSATDLYGLKSVTGGVFSLEMPVAMTPAAANVYLYCAVGLPMNVACSFTTVTANLTG